MRDLITRIFYFVCIATILSLIIRGVSLYSLLLPLASVLALLIITIISVIITDKIKDMRKK